MNIREAVEHIRECHHNIQSIKDDPQPAALSAAAAELLTAQQELGEYLQSLPRREIGNITNEYGGLVLVVVDNHHFWAIEAIDHVYHWQQIPSSLGLELLAFEESINPTFKETS